MGMVQTVRGPIDSRELGFTLMHEHLVSSQTGIPENYPQLYRKDWRERVLQDLREMKENGISTVVDATPFDLGRDAPMLKSISKESGMHIIACTGFFMEPSPMLGSYSVGEIARLFIDDATRGIAGTDIKAGIIKAAMDKEGPTPGRELTHRAAAVAAKHTGLRVMLHSYPQEEMGRHQLRFLREEGLDMVHVKVDHVLETTDMDYISWLYDQGCWLGVDRLPTITTEGHYCVGNAARIKTIYNMLKAGFADRMLLSHDFIATSTYFDHRPTPESQKFIDDQNPHRFLFMQKVVFPKLAEMGIDPALLKRIVTENPRRFFDGE